MIIDMSTELMIISALVMGGAAAYLAKQRKKDPFLWFCIGSFFGLLGVLYLYFFAKTPKAAPETPAPQPVPVRKVPLAPQKFWYYLDQENQQFGPMSYDALNKAWQDGKVSVETYVWNEDLENWKPFGDLISEG